MIKLPLDLLKDEQRGNECVILGNGPSLWDFDSTKLSWPMVRIGLNKSFEWGYSEYHVAIDPPWMQAWNDDKIDPHNCFVIPEYRQQKLKDLDKRVCCVAMQTKIPFGHNEQWRNDLALGGWPYTSGLLALQLAIHLGCTPINLLGFDCAPHLHWQLKYYKNAADTLARDDIFNCNPESLITYFPTKDEAWIQIKS